MNLFLAYMSIESPYRLLFDDIGGYSHLFSDEQFLFYTFVSNPST